VARAFCPPPFSSLRIKPLPHLLVESLSAIRLHISQAGMRAECPRHFSYCMVMAKVIEFRGGMELIEFHFGASLDFAGQFPGWLEVEHLPGLSVGETFDQA
jgi:hypothetical protein